MFNLSVYPNNIQYVVKYLSTFSALSLALSFVGRYQDLVRGRALVLVKGKGFLQLVAEKGLLVILSAETNVAVFVIADPPELLPRIFGVPVIEDSSKV